MAIDAAAVLKVRGGGEIHRILLGPGYGFEAVHAAVSALWPDLPEGAMKYMDGDGDWCTLVEGTYEDFIAGALALRPGGAGRPTLRIEVAADGGPGAPAAGAETAPQPRPRRLAPRRRRKAATEAAISFWEEDGRDIDELVREVETTPPVPTEESESTTAGSVESAQQAAKDAQARRRRRPPKKQRRSRDAAAARLREAESTAEPTDVAESEADASDAGGEARGDGKMSCPRPGDAAEEACAEPVEAAGAETTEGDGGGSGGGGAEERRPARAKCPELARSRTWPGPLAAAEPPAPAAPTEARMAEADVVEELCRALRATRPEAAPPAFWPPTPESTPVSSPRSSAGGSSGFEGPPPQPQQFVWVPVPVLVPEWLHQLPIVAC